MRIFNIMRECGLGMSNLVNSQVSSWFTARPSLCRPFRVNNMVVQHNFKSRELVQWDDQSVWANSSCCCWSWDFKTFFCQSWSQLQNSLAIGSWSSSMERLTQATCTSTVHWLWYFIIPSWKQHQVEFQARKHNLETPHVIEERTYDKVGSWGSWDPSRCSPSRDEYHLYVWLQIMWTMDYCQMHYSSEVHSLPLPSSFNLQNFESSG